MKTKVVLFLLAGCLLVAVAWLLRTPSPVEANDVPEKYRDTVQKGLDYLAKSQHKDGHWEGDGGKHPVAMTGLVGVALLMHGYGRNQRFEGNVAIEGKHAANIRKAVDWLLDKSQADRDGLIFSDHASETSRYMEGHGLATLFLAGALDDEQDDARRKKLRDVLTRAVKYIAKAQSSQGGRYHTSKAEGHDLDVSSATVIQIQALQVAESAAISVPGEAINDAHEYLQKTLRQVEADAKPEQNRKRLVDTAAVLACRNAVRSGEQNPAWRKWYAYCQTEVPLGSKIKLDRDELVHYYYAQAVYNYSDKAWNSYRTAMFEHLQSTQTKEGSWPAGDGISVGPVYATAVWCTILQLDTNRHPATMRIPVATR